MDACERIREHLSGCGLLSYAPGIAKGPCRAPYVVVRGAGSYRQGKKGESELLSSRVLWRTHHPKNFWSNREEHFRDSNLPCKLSGLSASL